MKLKFKISDLSLKNQSERERVVFSYLGSITALLNKRVALSLHNNDCCSPNKFIRRLKFLSTIKNI